MVTPEQVAVRIAIGFHGFRRAFKSTTRRAGARFESRDWASLQRDQLERIDAYGTAVEATITELAATGFSGEDRDTWSAARAMFRADHVNDSYQEIAETFFNSIARRLFGTKGIDPHLEFLAPAYGAEQVNREAMLRIYDHGEDRYVLLEELLKP